MERTKRSEEKFVFETSARMVVGSFDASVPEIRNSVNCKFTKRRFMKLTLKHIFIAL